MLSKHKRKIYKIIKWSGLVGFGVGCAVFFGSQLIQASAEVNTPQSEQTGPTSFDLLGQGSLLTGALALIGVLFTAIQVTNSEAKQNTDKAQELESRASDRESRLDAKLEELGKRLDEKERQHDAATTRLRKERDDLDMRIRKTEYDLLNRTTQYNTEKQRCAWLLNENKRLQLDLDAAISKYKELVQYANTLRIRYQKLKKNLESIDRMPGG
jgi:hypothetical protein